MVVWWLFEGVVVKNKTKGEKFEPKESRERNERELVVWLVGCCELDTRCGGGGGGPFVFEETLFAIPKDEREKEKERARKKGERERREERGPKVEIKNRRERRGKRKTKNDH